MLRRRPLPIVSRTAAAVFGLVLAISVVVLVVPVPSFDQSLQEGDIASRTLEAARDRQFESEGLTEAVRQQEADRVPDQGLPLDPALRQLQVDRLDRFFDQVRSIAARADSKQAKLELLTQVQTPSPILNSGRLSLLEMDRTTFEAFAVRAVKAVADVHNRPLQQVEITPRIDEYLTSLGATISSDEKTTLRATLMAFVTPTFQVDTDATERKRAEARANVSPQVVSYTRGQVIVNEGQRIKAEDIEALKATGVIDDTFDPYAIAGGAAAALALGALVAVYTYLMQPFQAPHRRRMVLVGISIFAVLVGARALLPLVTPDAEQHYFAFALPVAAAAIICAAFADLSLAAVVAVGAGLFAAFVGAAAPQLAMALGHDLDEGAAGGDAAGWRA